MNWTLFIQLFLIMFMIYLIIHALIEKFFKSKYSGVVWAEHQRANRYPAMRENDK